MDKKEQDDWMGLFPMPMTSIEKYHWFDDQPGYPNRVFTRLRFQGKLDQGLARRAWQITVDRQPFSDVEPKKIRGRWCWTLGPRQDTEKNTSFDSWNGTRFEWSERDTAPEPWQFDEHPIRGSTGSYLGVFAWPGSAQPGEDLGSAFLTEVWMCVHHAITDGIGGMIPINEWMVIYGNLVAGRPPEKGLHRFDYQLLKKRNHLGLLSWQYLKHLWKQPVALYGAVKFAFRKTPALIPEASGDQVVTSESRQGIRQFPAMIGQWLDEADVQRISWKAKANSVMPNSVMLAELYLALAQFRRHAGWQGDRDWIRVILPMSIRNVSDRRMPTANRATIVQIDRREDEAQDRSRFYRMLDREILIIRGWQLEKMFLIAIRLLAFFEPILVNAVKNDKSRGMAVFTNLGEPLRKIEKTRSRTVTANAVDSFPKPIEFDMAGPVRVGTAANFTVARYGSRLRITLHYDQNVVEPDQGKQLLQMFVQRLKSV